MGSRHLPMASGILLVVQQQQLHLCALMPGGAMRCEHRLHRLFAATSISNPFRVATAPTPTAPITPSTATPSTIALAATPTIASPSFSVSSSPCCQRRSLCSPLRWDCSVGCIFNTCIFDFWLCEEGVQIPWSQRKSKSPISLLMLYCRL